MKLAVRWLWLSLLSAVLVTCSAPQTTRPWKGDSLRVLREYLPNGELEPPDTFGAYSYVLIPRDARSDPRYLALLKAYAALPENPQECSTADLHRNNVTYVPVKLAPPREPLPESWLLDNYDESRAAKLLGALCLAGDGPYIVTSKTPLSRERPQICDEKNYQIPLALTVLDLSDVPQESMQAWLNYFVQVSSSPNDWASLRASEMILKLSDWLTRVGKGVTRTVESLGPLVKLIKITPLSK